MDQAAQEDSTGQHGAAEVNVGESGAESAALSSGESNAQVNVASEEVGETTARLKFCWSFDLIFWIDFGRYRRTHKRNTH